MIESRLLHRLSVPLLTIAGLAAHSAAGGELRVLVTPESGITVGDPVQLVLEVALEAGERVGDNDWSRTWLPEDLDAVELITVGVPQVETVGDRTTWRQIVTLRPFSTGVVELPAPPLDVADDRGRTTSIEAEPVVFGVESVLHAGGQIDLQPPAPVRPHPIGVAFWTLASVLSVSGLGTALAAAGAGAFASKEVRNVRLDPLVELRQALQRLDPRHPDHGHLGLSSSLRRFLERRTGTPALERTTTEIYADLWQLEVADTARREVRTILAACDQVKFGGFSSSRRDLGERVRRTQSVAEQIAVHLRAREQATEAERAAATESATQSPVGSAVS